MPHATAIRVYYEDTDFSGFVYHASYLRFFERGRTEFLRSLGASQSILQTSEAGLVFVVHRVVVDYHRPARMDDALSVETRVAEARGPLVRFLQVITRADETLARAEVSVIAVRDGRPVRIPANLVAAFHTQSAEDPIHGS